MEHNGIHPVPLDPVPPPEEAPVWQEVSREEETPFAAAQPVDWPTEEQPKSPPPKKSGKGKKGLALVLAALLVVGGGLFVASRRPGGEVESEVPAIDLFAVTLTATAESLAGLEPDSAFAITTPEPLTVTQLDSLLAIEPQVEYRLTDEGDGMHFALTPTQPLAEGTLFRLTLAQGESSRSFAFQSKTAFSVANAMPIGTYVPVDSGIELHFSGGAPSIEALTAAFSIEPRLDGHFERIHTGYVYRHEGLQPDTFYTLTLKDSLTSEGGRPLGESFRWSFRTEAQRRWYFWRGESQVTNLRPDQMPVLSCYSEDGLTSYTYEISVYRLDQSGFLEGLRTLHTYEQQLGSLGRCRLPVNGTKLYSLEGRLQKGQNDTLNLVLPESMAAGYYLVDAVCRQDESFSMSQLFQVSDTVAAVVAAEGELVLWANSAATGEPLAGVPIIMDCYSRAATDDHGLARIDTADLDPAQFSYLALETGSLPFMMTNPALPADEVLSAERRFHSVLWSDRTAYLPGEEVRFFAALQPRIGAVSPKEMQVSLRRWGVGPDGWDWQTLSSLTLTPGTYGAAAGALPLDGLTSGDYLLTLSAEGEELTSRSIWVFDYDKPTYVFDLTTDKAVYDLSEPIAFTAAASFYDGTPANGLRLALSYNDGQYNSIRDTLTLDEQGQYTEQITLPDNVTDWDPFHVSFSLSTAQAEDAESWGHTEAVVLPRDTMVAFFPAEDSWSTTLNFFEIDREALERGEALAWYGDEHLRGDAVTPQEVVCEVVMKTWHKTLVSVEYDYVNKKNIENYRYSLSERLLDSLTLLPENGAARVDLTPYALDEDSYFELRISYLDGRSRLTTDVTTLDPERNRGRSSDPYYFLSPEDDQFTFEVGDVKRFKLLDGGEETDAEGQLLLVSVCGGVTDARVVDAHDVSLSLDRDDRPGVHLCAAFFDGQRMHLLERSFLAYRPDAEGLTVSVQPDKDSYAPGDTVNLTIDVTDRGGAAAAAQVLVAVVDEAALAVMDNDINLLATLHRSVHDDEIRFYTSTPSRDAMGGEGGNGGGGDGLLRKDFADNPAFLLLETDRHGRASASFSLSDQVTSWRVTTLAVGEKAAAGQDVQNLSATLPFFVQPLVGETCLVGDDVVVSLRGFGSKLESGESVAFAAELIREGETGGMSLTGSGKAGEYVNLSFGKQAAGRYRLAVSGKSRNFSDALELELTVVEHRLTLPVSERLTFAELREFTPASFPLTLRFFDPAASEYASALLRLASLSGARTEQRIAGAAARTLLGGEAEVPDLSDVLTEGLSPLPTMDRDLLLTAKAALTAPQLLPATTADYLFDRLDGASGASADEAVACYLGLAALGQPVLNDIRSLLLWQPAEGGEADPLTLRQRMILIAALAAIGDQDGARALYQSEILPLMTLDGEQLNFGYERESLAADVEQTALALLTAAVVAPEDADRMVAWLLANPDPHCEISLELLHYVTCCQPVLEAPVTFGVQLEGETVELSTGRFGTTALTLSKAQWESLQLPEEDPGLTVAALHIAPAERLDAATAEAKAITRTIRPVRGGSIRQSELLEVQLELGDLDGLPLGSYRLVDTLPSGTRFVSRSEIYLDSTDQSRWFPLWQEGQEISFGLNLTEDGRETVGSAVTYYVRAVLPGEFALEAPVLLHESGAVCGLGEAETLTIRP